METDFRVKLFFIGMFGDFLLQLISKLRGDIAGLKPYFELHGSLEAAFIAGGTMFIAAHIYNNILRLDTTNVITLFIYGGVLDIIWRQFHLMKTLDETYYKALNPILSFIWGGIPMILHILLDRLL